MRRSFNTKHASCTMLTTRFALMFGQHLQSRPPQLAAR